PCRRRREGPSLRSCRRCRPLSRVSEPWPQPRRCLGRSSVLCGRGRLWRRCVVGVRGRAWCRGVVRARRRARARGGSGVVLPLLLFLLRLLLLLFEGTLGFLGLGFRLPLRLLLSDALFLERTLLGLRLFPCDALLL